MSMFRLFKSSVPSRRRPDEPLNIPIPRRTGATWMDHGDPLDIPFDLTHPEKVREDGREPLDMPVASAPSRAWSETGAAPVDVPIEPHDGKE